MTTAGPAKSGTQVPEPRKALTREEAIRYLAGADLRPMLVLRECSRCNKTDDALLQPGADNEKVAFLSRWFRCIRLPIDVIQPDHPFHALFAGDAFEHLFVITADGTKKHGLESDTSRTELCAAMSAVLVASYVKDPTPLYKEIHVFGGQLDALDRELFALENQRSDIMEERTPDKKKLAKVEGEIAAVKKKISDKLASIEKASKIDLKPPPEAPKKPD